jgi:hypothetical protein
MPGEFDAPIQKALDDYELMRRKAAAWDALTELMRDQSWVRLYPVDLQLMLETGELPF